MVMGYSPGRKRQTCNLQEKQTEYWNIIKEIKNLRRRVQAFMGKTEKFTNLKKNGGTSVPKNLKPKISEW